MDDINYGVLKFLLFVFKIFNLFLGKMRKQRNVLLFFIGDIFKFIFGIVIMVDLKVVVDRVD